MNYKALKRLVSETIHWEKTNSHPSIKEQYTLRSTLQQLDKEDFDQALVEFEKNQIRYSVAPEKTLTAMGAFLALSSFFRAANQDYLRQKSRRFVEQGMMFGLFMLEPVEVFLRIKQDYHEEIQQTDELITIMTRHHKQKNIPDSNKIVKHFINNGNWTIAVAYIEILCRIKKKLGVYDGEFLAQRLQQLQIISYYVEQINQFQNCDPELWQVKEHQSFAEFQSILNWFHRSSSKYELPSYLTIEMLPINNLLWNRLLRIIEVASRELRHCRAPLYLAKSHYIVAYMFWRSEDFSRAEHIARRGLSIVNSQNTSHSVYHELLLDYLNLNVLIQGSQGQSKEMIMTANEIKHIEGTDQIRGIISDWQPFFIREDCSTIVPQASDPDYDIELDINQPKPNRFRFDM